MLVLLIISEVIIVIIIVFNVRNIKRILKEGEKYKGEIVEIIEELNSENDTFFYSIVEFVDKNGQKRKIKINDERYTRSFIIGETIEFYYNVKVNYALPEGSIITKWWPALQWGIAFIIILILFVGFVIYEM